MNTVVLNLQTLAVTEHSGPLTGLAGDYESSTAGVHKIDSATSDAAEASWSFGVRLSESSRRQRAKYLYAFGRGLADMAAVVEDGGGNTYEYPLQMLHGKAGRFQLGAGIRDNYLGVTMRRASTEPMNIDRVEFEALVASARRL